MPTHADPDDRQSRNVPDRSDAERSDAERTEVDRSDVKRSDVKRTDAEGSDVERTDAEGSDVERTDAEGSDAERTDAEGSDAERTDAERTDAERIDVVVLREGTEGLSMESYTAALRERLPDRTVVHARTPAEEREYVTRARVVTGLAIEPELLSRADRLELFACTFAGTDYLPLDVFADHGVTVTNAGGIHAPGIAEQAIGNLLVFTRRLHEGWRRKNNGEWRHFQSHEFAGSTVTIVGLGSIGKAIVARLQGFDVETVGVRYTPEKGGPTDEVVGFDEASVHDAFARSDYVVLACPLTDTTRHLVDEAAFATLPPHAVLVNAARGGIVDTDALVTALQYNGIRGAALDVSEPEPLPNAHPLWDLENCLITPHTGGHTPKHWDRLAAIVADNVAALDGDGDLRNVVVRGSR